MSFTTKLDYSNNRQIKQFQLSSTQLSGTTTFGVDDVYIPMNITGDTINIDALQYIKTRGIILPNALPLFTGATSQVLGRDNSTGKLVEISGSTGSLSLTTTGTTGPSTLIGSTLNVPQYTGGGGTNTDDYVSGGTFNTSTGDLTLTRISGGTVVTNLDDRYSLTGHTHTLQQVLDSGYVVTDANGTVSINPDGRLPFTVSKSNADFLAGYGTFFNITGAQITTQCTTPTGGYASVGLGFGNLSFNLSDSTGTNVTQLGFQTPIAGTTLEFPAKSVGFYTIATISDIALTSLNEGNGIGYRLTSTPTVNVGNIGYHAIDMGEYYAPSTTEGALADHAFIGNGDSNSIRDTSYGGYTLGGGANVITGASVGAGALGNFNTINNAYGGLAAGVYNTVNVNNLGGGIMAWGHGNSVTGEFPLGAIGLALVANSRNHLVVGVSNIIYTGSTSAADRPIFTVGIGTHFTPSGQWTANVRADGLKVLANGQVIAPSQTVALINSESTGRILTSREWVTGHTATLTGGTSGSTNTNDYVTGATFNTSTGDLTLSRISGGTVVENLDGRYLTGTTANFYEPVLTTYTTSGTTFETGFEVTIPANTLNLDGDALELTFLTNSAAVNLLDVQMSITYDNVTGTMNIGQSATGSLSFTLNGTLHRLSSTTGYMVLTYICTSRMNTTIFTLSSTDFTSNQPFIFKLRDSAGANDLNLRAGFVKKVSN